MKMTEPATYPNRAQTIPRARVTPVRTLATLSRAEIAALCENPPASVIKLLRSCCLAVLSSGLELDDARALFERYRNFDVRIERENQGVCLALSNAPAGAFVAGRIVDGVREQLFAVLRDLLFTSEEICGREEQDAAPAASISPTESVFRTLRNATILDGRNNRSLVVCWGGHAIGRAEYEYSKDVGYALGLHGFDVCTGCGPGAMKGPMKGALVGHAKQRISDGRFVGITEPGIIAAESPNPIVNRLVIMPNMERRLEAFVRLAHGVVVFPGGVGTVEEILYVLGVLGMAGNEQQLLPILFTGPAESADFFESLDGFIRAVLGDAAAARYRVVIDDPSGVASALSEAVDQVQESRRQQGDALFFNWHLNIDPSYQTVFVPTHERMAALDLSPSLETPVLAGQLRHAFSGIVAANVKADFACAVEERGPIEIRGAPVILRAMERLLESFVRDGRMRLGHPGYEPTYRFRSA